MIETPQFLEPSWRSISEGEDDDEARGALRRTCRWFVTVGEAGWIGPIVQHPTISKHQLLTIRQKPLSIQPSKVKTVGKPDSWLRAILSGFVCSLARCKKDHI